MRNLLKQMGVPLHFKGYKYILTALDLLEEDSNLLYKLSVDGGLYQRVAKAHGENDRRNVERGIRNAIEKAWYTGQLLTWEELFPNNILHITKPTNAQFLATLLEEAEVKKAS